MISQMWEPHQTSAFLNAFLIWIYMLITGTTTGIALYLNVVGLIVKLGVAYVFYRTFRKTCNQFLLFFMCSYFLTVNAKNYIILEFSNLMIYFSVLLLCNLFLHFQRQKPVYLILSVVCFCLEVLSYPSAIILFPLLLFFLYRYSVMKMRDIILFAGGCSFAGIGFFLCLVIRTGWIRFWECIQNIIMGDNTHPIGDYTRKLGVFMTDIRDIVFLFAACALISVVIVIYFSRRKKISVKSCFIKSFFVMLFFYSFVQILLDPGKDGPALNSRWLYSAIYLPILVLAIQLRKNCNKEEAIAFQLGVGIGTCGCFAVLFLTNLTFLTTLAYLIPGIMVSMMPIGEYLIHNSCNVKAIKTYGMMILFIVVFLSRNIYVIRPLSWHYATVFSIRGVVKDGPMAGILSDYMGAYIRNSNLNDWKQFVRKGDKVLIVGDPVSTIGYLYEDTEVSIDSTISTPTYSEKLLTYWKMNPWKEPNVVVLDCWFGEPRISQNTWIMEWVEEHFESYVDGRYVRIYRRE